MEERLLTAAFSLFSLSEDHPRGLNIIIHPARTILQSWMQEGGNGRMNRERLSASRCFSFSPGNRFASRSRMVSPRFFQLQNSKPRGGGSIAARLISPIPVLTYRFDSSRHCPERSLVNSIATEKVRFLARLCSGRNIEFLTFIVRRLSND